MRKVMGAGRRQLIGQFLGESLLVSMLALVLAVALLHALLPLFNTLTGKALAIEYLENRMVLAGLLGLTLIVGAGAGSYPAFLLSAFRPVMVLKGLRSKTGGAVMLRKGLVVFQFTISTALIIATLVVLG